MKEKMEIPENGKDDVEHAEISESRNGNRMDVLSENKGRKRKSGVFRRLLKLKRLWLILFFPAGLLLLWLAGQSQYFAEMIYARGIFKGISQGLEAVTGLVPFSIAECLVIAAPFAAVLILALWIAGIVRHRGERVFRVLRGAVNVLCAGALVYFIYVTGCGINYYRYPFSYFVGLEVRPSSAEELAALCSELALQANELRAGLPENEDGVYEMSMSIGELGEEVVLAYENAKETWEILGGKYPAPKAVYFSRVMSKTELTGIYTCFTMEANVNVDVSDYSIASTMCHEEAHLRGFIREDEANYISWLVCGKSDNAEVRYSGVMEALILVGNALYRKNPDLYSEVRATYSEQVNADLRANSEYWAQFEDTVISNTATTLNDAYLKANNQSDGVQSYGRMVDLLLAEYRARTEETEK